MDSFQEKREDRIKVFIRIKPSEGTSHLFQKPYLTKVDEKHLDAGGKVMAYDSVFPTDILQHEVFEEVALPVV